MYGVVGVGMVGLGWYGWVWGGKGGYVVVMVSMGW